MINPSEELAIPIPRFVPLRYYEYILYLNICAHICKFFKRFF